MGEPLADSGIREGSAKIFSVADKDAKGKQNVFYNPAQVYNRDLSILVLTVYSVMRRIEEKEKERTRLKNKKQIWEPYEGLSILEALAASGLRSVRYWKEIPHVKHITVNDFDATAVEHMRKNLLANSIPIEQTQRDVLRPPPPGTPSSTDPGAAPTKTTVAFQKVRPNHGDAILHCYTEGHQQYDVIDLDPYGTASPFLDAAIRGVKNGGLLCVTSTDMPILGGNHPETCFYRYGGTPLKARYVHEMSLRLLLNAITSTAARHQRIVEPLLCASMDFYIRVFVRVRDSPLQAKDLAKNTGIVLQCTQCECFHVQPMGSQEFENKKSNKATAAPPAGDAKDPCGAAAGKPEPDAEAPAESAEEIAEEEENLDERLQELLRRARRGQPPVQARKGLKYKSAKMAPGGSECTECGGRMAIGGPCYLGPLHDPDFLDACLAVCALNQSSSAQKEEVDEAQDQRELKKRKLSAGEPGPAGDSSPTAASTPGGATQKAASAGSQSVSAGGPQSVDSTVLAASPALDLSRQAQVCVSEDDFRLPHISQWKKIEGMLTAMSEELPDVPLHYNLPSLCSSLRVDCVPMLRFRGALRSLGYRASHFHRDANAVKTDADNTVVYDLVRKWAKERLAVKPSASSAEKASKKERKRAEAHAVHGKGAAERILEKAITTDGVNKINWETCGIGSIMSDSEDALGPQPKRPKLESQEEIILSDDEDHEEQERQKVQWEINKVCSPNLSVIGHPHPSSLWESIAARTVPLPPLPEDLSLRIPYQVLEKKRLSQLQLETISYAVARLNEADPLQRGYLLGDGTGSGKGRTIAAIILHYWNCGLKKHIWFSTSRGLIEDATRDFRDLCGVTEHQVVAAAGGAGDGGDELPFEIYDVDTLVQRWKEEKNRLPAHQDPHLPGVLFLSYHKIARGSDDVSILKTWFRKQEGVLAFDEAHRAKNLQKNTATGREVRNWQTEYAPNARVIYASATAATELSNLAYMTRAGLWGKDEFYRTFDKFSNSIRDYGVTGMEMIAMNLRAYGLMSCKSLSYEGCDFELVKSTVSKKMRTMYDATTEVVLGVQQELWDALQTAADEVSAHIRAGRGLDAFRNTYESEDPETRRPLSIAYLLIAVTKHLFVEPKAGEERDEEKLLEKAWGLANVYFRMIFWGFQQRFYKQLLVSMKVEKAVELCKEALKEDEQVVFSMWMTMEGRIKGDGLAARSGAVRADGAGDVGADDDEFEFERLDADDVIDLESDGSEAGLEEGNASSPIDDAAKESGVSGAEEVEEAQGGANAVVVAEGDAPPQNDARPEVQQPRARSAREELAGLELSLRHAGESTDRCGVETRLPGKSA
eukprot:g13576.t1